MRLVFTQKLLDPVKGGAPDAIMLQLEQRSGVGTLLKAWEKSNKMESVCPESSTNLARSSVVAV